MIIHKLHRKTWGTPVDTLKRSFTSVSAVFLPHVRNGIGASTLILPQNSLSTKHEIEWYQQNGSQQIISIEDTTHSTWRFARTRVHGTAPQQTHASSVPSPAVSHRYPGRILTQRKRKKKSHKEPFLFGLLFSLRIALDILSYIMTSDSQHDRIRARYEDTRQNAQQLKVLFIQPLCVRFPKVFARMHGGPFEFPRTQFRDVFFPGALSWVVIMRPWAKQSVENDSNKNKIYLNFWICLSSSVFKNSKSTFISSSTHLRPRRSSHVGPTWIIKKYITFKE
jgi:hypothetical protein